MKKNVLAGLCALVSLTQSSLAQTNTFPSSGYVGIGTSAPSSLLTVNTSLDPSSSPSLLLNNTYSGYGNSITFSTAGTVQGVVRADQNGNLGFDSKANVDFNYYGSTGDVNFWKGRGTGTDALELNFLIKNNGNVGIGTRAPDSKLTVNGTIHCKEVKVDMNILPDYVFSPAYDLAPLTKVKAYIEQYHHLPDVPSAQQVAKEGLNLGEMNAMLLKKVEELTLYLIEKDKQDKQKDVQLQIQQERLNAQQQQINQLKEQMDTLPKALPKN